MLALAVFLLYFAFKGVKWEDFVNGIKSCNFWWIMASMGASILAFVVRGFRWRLTLQPLNPAISRREAYDGVTITYLTNFAVPRLGEFARCGVIASTGKASFEAVLGTVVLERAWDMISYIVILVIVLLAGQSSFGQFVSREVWAPAMQEFNFNIVWIVAAVVVAIILIFVLIYIYRNKLRKYKFFAKLFSICKGLIDGLVSGLKMKNKWGFFGYTILLWTCYWMMSYFTILAFPQVTGLNWADALFLMVVGSLGWIVPVQGGIGAYHFILSLALSLIYGIPQTSGVVFATISHESQMVTMLVCGAISLAVVYWNKRKSKSRQS